MLVSANSGAALVVMAISPASQSTKTVSAGPKWRYVSGLVQRRPAKRAKSVSASVKKSWKMSPSIRFALTLSVQISSSSMLIR